MRLVCASLVYVLLGLEFPIKTRTRPWPGSANEQVVSNHFPIEQHRFPVEQNTFTNDIHTLVNIPFANVL